jgi:hypothetical protein
MNSKKFQERILGSSAQEDAHGIASTAISKDKKKQRKTIYLRLPDHAPAGCPAGTPLPLTLNNTHFNESKADDFDLIPHIDRFGAKWKKDGQKREHVHVFVAFYVMIDGTIRAFKQDKSKAKDPLSALFNGTLNFDDDDSDEDEEDEEQQYDDEEQKRQDDLEDVMNM